MMVFGKEREYIVHDDNNIKGFFGDFRFLSNFDVCDVYFDGQLYGSSEAAYMAGKTLDLELRKKFLKETGITPSEARKMGKALVLRPDWDAVRYDHMAAVVFDKFSRNKDLRRKLLATGEKYIEETNHWKDTYWGVCNGVGESNLGRILMAVRSFWRAKDKQTKVF